jgi:mycothiol synthase
VTLPPGYRFRPPRDEDAAAVAEIANEEAEAFLGTRVFSAEWLLRNWTAPSTDRERDVAVVEAPDGSICGYLGLGADPPFSEVSAVGIVALPYHGRGLGSAIVAENERRAIRFAERSGPGARLAIQSDALLGEPRAAALLTARGYREVRRFHLMRIDFAGEPPAPAGAGGVDIRTLNLDEGARRVYEAHREAFADAWGMGEESYDDFLHYYLGGPGFDPALCLVAWSGDDVAGYLTAIEESEEHPSRGYVRSLGVRRAYRGRGIGEALLRTAFRSLHERGKAGCDLHVDSESPTGAPRLYERVGMTAHPRFATWEKELRPGVHD